MSLSTYDAVIAENECPCYKQTFHSYDYSMSVLKEKLETQSARESTDRWKVEVVQHMAPLSAESRREMQQFVPLLRNWEVDVAAGRFTVSADTTLSDVTVLLMEYRDRAGNFQSKAFNNLFG